MASQDSPTAQLEPIPAQQIPKLGHTTRRKSNKPPSVKAAVLAKAMLGTSMSQISRDLDISRPTVAVILADADISQHARELRSDMVLNGDLVKSVQVMRSKLRKGSESAATTILRGFNVLQSNPKVEVNVLNVSAASYAQRMQAKAQEAIELKTGNNQVESSESSEIAK